MKQCPPEGRCAEHYLGNAEAGFTCGGQEHLGPQILLPGMPSGVRFARRCVSNSCRAQRTGLKLGPGRSSPGRGQSLPG